MTTILRALLFATIAAVLVTAAGVRSDAAERPAARNPYDGRWSVVINTLRGDCDRTLRYSLRIVGGRVVADEQSYQVAGLVRRDGNIRVVVAEAGRSARGAGRLLGNSGHGLWHTDTGACTGQWVAERRPDDF
jgi:hypothetical protein